jgi:hypothetical protein
MESPLAQSVTRDGKTVRVDICTSDAGGWLLEVVDEHGNSTVRDDSFASDQQALDEALRTIDVEGIDALIGMPAEDDRSPGRKSAPALDGALSDDELDELDDFLADEAIQDTSMDVAAFDGLLTAIAIGRGFVHPMEWLPWVWDMEDARRAPKCKDDDGATWMNEIEPLLLEIPSYWTERRGQQSGGLIIDDLQPGRQRETSPIVRGNPKVGRSDPCPCGSGRKYKKCCGSGDTPPLVH